MFNKFYYHLSSFALTASLLSTLASANLPSLMDLPQELLVEVAAKLSPPDAARFAQTSNACNVAVTDAQKLVARANLAKGMDEPFLSRIFPNTTIILRDPPVTKFSAAVQDEAAVPFDSSGFKPIIVTERVISPLLSAVNPSLYAEVIMERLKDKKPILVSMRSQLYDVFLKCAREENIPEYYISELLPESVTEEDQTPQTHAFLAGLDHRFGEYKLFVHYGMQDTIRPHIYKSISDLRTEISRDYVAFCDEKANPTAKYVVLRESEAGNNATNDYDTLNNYFAQHRDKTLLIDSESIELGMNKYLQRPQAQFSIFRLAFSDSMHMTHAIGNDFLSSFSLFARGNPPWHLDLSALREVIIVGERFLQRRVVSELDISGFRNVIKFGANCFESFKGPRILDFSALEKAENIGDLFLSNLGAGTSYYNPEFSMIVVDPYEVVYKSDLQRARSIAQRKEVPLDAYYNEDWIRRDPQIRYKETNIKN